RIALELRPLARSVAVTEDQQIELGRRIAALVQLDQRSGVGRLGAVGDELVRGIDGERPDVPEGVARIALPERDAHRCVWRGKPQRFRERAIDLLRLGRRLPLAVDGAETARVLHAAGRGISDLEEVLAAVGVVERLGRIAWPRQRLQDDAVEAETLFFLVAG